MCIKLSGNLTQREETILKIIKDITRERGYPPSVREIGQKAGLRSSSTVHSYLKRLEAKGCIRRDPTKPRAIEILNSEDGIIHGKVKWIPIIGQVAAGNPLLAEEYKDGYFPLPEDFTSAEDLYMLKIKGDSMVEAGIIENDMVIVKGQPTANNGEIVVALLENEATVKRFFKDNGYVKLQPENKHLSTIITKDVKILGKVIGLIRKI